MIRYALCCDEGHRFDSWFFDSSAFDEQAQRGLVACPICESRHVVKAIMAPAVVAKRGRRSGAVAPAEGVGAATAGPDAPSTGFSAASSQGTGALASSKPLEVALFDEGRRQLVRAFRDKVLAETRDVGRAFASEARRIHDRDGPEERIRGQATLEEARDLLEDGIMVLPLPAVPDDLN